MISLTIPNIPPSANKAYVNQRGGKGRVLSREGKRYKLETTTYIARKYPQALQFFHKNHPYLLVIQFLFGDNVTLLNKGWPEKTDSRYKKLDVGNRLKLFEDALSDATGIDDSHHWTIIISKRLHVRDLTTVAAYDMELEQDDALLRALAAVPSNLAHEPL